MVILIYNTATRLLFPPPIKINTCVIVSGTCILVQSVGGEDEVSVSNLP